MHPEDGVPTSGGLGSSDGICVHLRAGLPVLACSLWGQYSFPRPALMEATLMRKSNMILVTALALAMAAPAVQAQGRPGGAGGGPPAGVGGGMGGPPTGMGGSAGMGGYGGMNAPGRSMGDSMSNERSGSLREAAMQRRADAQARRTAAADKGLDKAQFGRSTAERAKALKDADLETRKAFGTYQAAAAKQKSLEASVAGSTDNSARASTKAAFGKDTAARAKALREADLDTRKAFGALQAAAAKGKALGSGLDLVTTTPASSEKAAFGTETSARAQLQKDATVGNRKTFGKTQSALAQAQREDKADRE